MCPLVESDSPHVTIRTVSDDHPSLSILKNWEDAWNVVTVPEWQEACAADQQTTKTKADVRLDQHFHYRTRTTESAPGSKIKYFKSGHVPLAKMEVDQSLPDFPGHGLGELVGFVVSYLFRFRFLVFDSSGRLILCVILCVSE